MGPVRHRGRAVAVAAFTTYAMALPSSVFVSIFKTAELWGAASALVLALIMPAVAGAFGITSS
jgi:exosortase/archaeosortase